MRWLHNKLHTHVEMTRYDRGQKEWVLLVYRKYPRHKLVRIFYAPDNETEYIELNGLHELETIMRKDD